MLDDSLDGLVELTERTGNLFLEVKDGSRQADSD